MKNSYDKLAWAYDPLSRLVFFKAQVSAQVCLLPYIPKNSNILIAGGGTGWILEELSKIHPSGLTIVYVELSQKMIEKAQRRDYKNNKVIFINQAMEDFETEDKYDVIMAAFFFDNFTEDKAGTIFHQLDNKLKPNGLWLFSDFIFNKSTGKPWQAWLLRIMYLFFKITCNIEARHVVDMQLFFKSAGYKKLFETYRYGKFIKSDVYRKTDD